MRARNSVITTIWRQTTRQWFPGKLIRPFYSATSSRQQDEESPGGYKAGGYHPVTPGSTLNQRYTITRKLGFGQFSTVWLAKDEKATDDQHKHVAIKILTADSSQDTRQLDELKILKRVKEVDRTHLGLDGPHGEHLCMVTEVLGTSVGALRHRFQHEMLPIPLTKQVAKQLLLGLDYLHWSCKVLHCDVQPSNILLAVREEDFLPSEETVKQSSDASSEKQSHSVVASQPIVKEIDRNQRISIKLADFGVAMTTDHNFEGVIQPVALRAPEVILGIRWDTPVDIWSAGCLLAIGYALFRPRAGEVCSLEEDHLAQMFEILGDFPKELVSKGKQSKKYFDENGNLKHATELRRIKFEDIIRRRIPKMGEKEVAQFAAFLRSMLRYEPAERPQAAELAVDPWLS